MALRTLLVLGSLASALAAPASSCANVPQQYNTPSGFDKPACAPDGYFQAQDLGNTNPTDAQTRCTNACNGYGDRCIGFLAAVWKAADSNNYSGQCYYYSTYPSAPRTCADTPTLLVAQVKDKSLECLNANPSAATPYCSSLLSFGVKTVYSSTVTPIATLTSVKTVTATVNATNTITTFTSATVTPTTVTIPVSLTSTISTDTTTTSTDTTILTATASSTATVTDVITSIIQSTVTASALTTTTITSTTSTTTIIPPSGAALKKRATSVAPPACLTTSSVPISRVSSACSCLAITSATVTTVSTAPTSTLTVFSTESATVTSTLISTQVVTNTVSFTGTVSSTVTVFKTITATAVAKVTDTVSVTSTVAATTTLTSTFLQTQYPTITSTNTITTTTTTTSVATFSAAPVVNSGFDSSLNSWSANVNLGNFQWSTVNHDAHSAPGAAQIAVTSAFTGFGRASLYQPVYTIPGRTYTASVWANVPLSSSLGNGALTCYDGGRGTNQYVQFFRKAGGYYQYTTTCTFSSTSGGVQIGLSWSGASGPETIFIDDVTLTLN